MANIKIDNLKSSKNEISKLSNLQLKFVLGGIREGGCLKW